MKILIERAGRLTEVDDDEAVAASVGNDNPLETDWDPTPALAATSAKRPLILWSGSCAETLFEAHPHTWGAPGWERLDTVCRTLTPLLDERDTEACFRPHARHVLSDAPSCRRFLRDHGDGPFGLALAPALMLEPSMLPEVEDHLTRIFEAVGGSARFLFLSDVTAAEGTDACRGVPLGEGVLPRPHVMRLIAEHVAPDTPIVLMEGALANQLAWIGAGSASV